MQALPHKLSDQDRLKLAKLLALTASDADGEALNAIRAANRFVTDRGLTWHEAVGVDPSAKIEDDPFERFRGGWRGATELCIRRGQRVLSPWEFAFLRALKGWAGEPSRKQKGILYVLVSRVVASGAARAA
jgi:hypothetical protein